MLISKMPGIKVRFLLAANGVDTSCFNENPDYPEHLEASLSDVENDDKIEIKTTINGKVVASNEIMF